MSNLRKDWARHAVDDTMRSWVPFDAHLTEMAQIRALFTTITGNGRSHYHQLLELQSVEFWMNLINNFQGLVRINLNTKESLQKYVMSIKIRPQAIVAEYTTILNIVQFAVEKRLTLEIISDTIILVCETSSKYRLFYDMLTLSQFDIAPITHKTKRYSL